MDNFKCLFKIKNAVPIPEIFLKIIHQTFKVGLSKGKENE